MIISKSRQKNNNLHLDKGIKSTPCYSKCGSTDGLSKLQILLHLVEAGKSSSSTPAYLLKQT